MPLSMAGWAEQSRISATGPPSKYCTVNFESLPNDSKPVTLLPTRLTLRPCLMHGKGRLCQHGSI